MKKIITALMTAVTLSASAPVMAEPVEEYYTMDSMGCMLLQECTDDVQEVFSLLDISSQYDNTDSFTSV